MELLVGVASRTAQHCDTMVYDCAIGLRSLLPRWLYTHDASIDKKLCFRREDARAWCLCEVIASAFNSTFATSALLCSWLPRLHIFTA